VSGVPEITPVDESVKPPGSLLFVAPSGKTSSHVIGAVPVAKRFALYDTVLVPSGREPETIVGLRGSAETVTAQTALLLLPSFVLTVTVAVPTPVAVTLPLLSTAATFTLLLVHVRVLFAVFSGTTVATSVSVLPTLPKTSCKVVLFKVIPEAAMGFTVILKSCV
jgi:hypothetical protein